MPKEKVSNACASKTGSTLDDTTRYDVNQVKAEFNAAFEESQTRVPTNGVWDTAITFDPAERKRAWWFLLYPESMNPNAMQILAESGYQGAVSPLHDSDKFADGTPKKPHFHVLVYVSGKVTENTLKPLLDSLNGVRAQPVGSVTGACRYLAHMDIDPDNIPSDIGKVRYSPDDIVTFGGFDVKSFLKATQTQIAKALREMYEFIEVESITSYYGFMCWIYETHPEYEYLLANPQVTAQVDRFIRSKFAVIHRNDELDALEKTVNDQQQTVNRAVASVTKLETVTQQLIDALKGIYHV